MRALLDSHTFLWWITDSPELSSRVRRILADSSNEIFFSAASAWELAIKIGLGKLPFTGDPSKVIPQQLAVNSFVGLPVDVTHALRVASLPQLHRDPFDRMIVVQAQIENLTILSRDPEISKYEVKVLW